MKGRNVRWWWLVPLVLVLSMVAAACSDAGEGDSDAGGDDGGTTTGETADAGALPGEGTEINIAVNPWTGSAVSTALSGFLVPMQKAAQELAILQDPGHLYMRCISCGLVR